MNILMSSIWLLILIGFVYTAGFAYTLWKQKNRIGAFSIFLLACAIIVTPFFSVLK
ncbi:hypothetical protein ACLIBH_13395 [Virgibacillus sp. W0430]|uniref:hypothetical protein n=1 Tax=Virgibacillus sp. W0430 TaxID=3391580 RepID=UPI003F473B42